MKSRKTPRQARADDLDAAITYAREFLIELAQDGELCNSLRRSRTPYDYKTRLADHDFDSREFVSPLTWNEKFARATIEQARLGDAVAAQGLRLAAAELLRKRHPLPDSLRDWLSDHLEDERLVVKPSSRRGPKPDELRTRDRGLALVIRTLTEEPWGFPATRNRATKTESACSVVHKATAGSPGINLSESTLEKIWERHRRRPEK